MPIFKSVKVELENGDIVDITDLPQDKYEYFLNMIVMINNAYRLMILKGEIINSNNYESQPLQS